MSECGGDSRFAILEGRMVPYCSSRNLSPGVVHIDLFKVPIVQECQTFTFAVTQGRGCTFALERWRHDDSPLCDAGLAPRPSAAESESRALMGVGIRSSSTPRLLRCKLAVLERTGLPTPIALYANVPGHQEEGQQALHSLVHPQVLRIAL